MPARARAKAKPKPAAMPEPKIEMRDPKDLIPYARNANTHPPEQISKIMASINALGFRAPIMYHEEHGIAAGHGRLEAALKMGLEAVPCVDCSDMSEADFRAYVIADNRIAQDAVIDEEMLGAEMRALAQIDNLDLDAIGFDKAELDEMLGGVGTGEGEGGNDEERYTQKVESPVYEMKGEKPDVSELLDRTKASQLLDEIDETDGLPDDVVDFLRFAALRHAVFNFEKVAEFYAHADAATQYLMERSALVIIDYNQAIENGFVRLTEQVAHEYDQIADNDGGDDQEPASGEADEG